METKVESRILNNNVLTIGLWWIIYTICCINVEKSPEQVAKISQDFNKISTW